MARVTAGVLDYDVTDADTSSAEPVPAGIYEAVIEDIELGPSKSSNNPMLTITFTITKGDHKNRKFWHYILVDGTQDWRLREFTDALGLPVKGKLQPDKLKGTVVQLKTIVQGAKDGYDASGKVKNVMPAVSSNGASAEGEEAPYEEWELSELKEELAAREIEAPPKARKTTLVKLLEADDAAAEEGEEDEGDEEGEDEALTMGDLEGMDRAELKALIKEEGLEIRVTTKTTDETLREKIAEALEIGGGDEEEDEDEEEEDEDERPDLDSMDRAALKAYIKSEGVEVKVLTKDTEETLRSKIADALGWDTEEAEEDEEEEDEEVEPYDQWELADIKAELKERGLKIDGRKTVLVKRLEQDDQKDGDPF